MIELRDEVTVSGLPFTRPLLVAALPFSQARGWVGRQRGAAPTGRCGALSRRFPASRLLDVGRSCPDPAPAVDPSIRFSRTRLTGQHYWPPLGRTAVTVDTGPLGPGGTPAGRTSLPETCSTELALPPSAGPRPPADGPHEATASRPHATSGSATAPTTRPPSSARAPRGFTPPFIAGAASPAYLEAGVEFSFSRSAPASCLCSRRFSPCGETMSGFSVRRRSSLIPVAQRHTVGLEPVRGTHDRA